eukprot:scaffold1436_cov112-Cylindrotheca_fusiformis.AAC.6
MKIDEVGSKNEQVANRESCRINSGAAIVIPHVLPFSCQYLRGKLFSLAHHRMQFIVHRACRNATTSLNAYIRQWYKHARQVPPIDHSHTVDWQTIIMCRSSRITACSFHRSNHMIAFAYLFSSVPKPMTSNQNLQVLRFLYSVSRITEMGAVGLRFSGFAILVKDRFFGVGTSSLVHSGKPPSSSSSLPLRKDRGKTSSARRPNKSIPQS